MVAVVALVASGFAVIIAHPAPASAACSVGAPDPLDGADGNCDGQDGVLAVTMFVSPAGTDVSTCGTPASPCLTIGQGQDRASSLGYKQVEVAAGTYGAFAMKDGLEVGGGYNAGTWTKTGAKTHVTGSPNGTFGGSVSVFADGITNPTRLYDVVIDGATAGTTQASYGLVVTGDSSSAFKIDTITVNGGVGGKGTNGTDGSGGWINPAPTGGSGGPGLDPGGVCDTETSGAGGIGENGGGNGGRGGHIDTDCGVFSLNFSAESGVAGQTVGGAVGGSGGSAENGGACSGNRVTDGHVGNPGANGGAGTVGNQSTPVVGTFTGGSWSIGSGGGNGGLGTNAQPGSGGGGGGGTDCGTDDAGAGGGGGGAPGLRATVEGTGGGAGSASLGVFLLDGSPTLTNVTINTGTGGAGGKGGAGAAGQPGGSGGPGGTPYDRGGAGGDGGPGGNGGSSGAGAGGPGGPAIGYAMQGRSRPVGTPVVSGGVGGAGGSAGNPGPGGSTGSPGPTGLVVGTLGSPASPADFGDAPRSYGVIASNTVVNGFSLGPTITADAGAKTSFNALGDSSDDGVAFGSLVPGSPVSITLSLTNAAGTASPKARVWFDWNRDGDFADAGELAVTDAALGATTVLTPTVPSGASRGTTFARVRLSSGTGVGPNAVGGSGEVEDYQLSLGSADYGDAPDTFGTTFAAGGPIHQVVPGFSLGDTVDAEGDGQPTTDASGDGADEDGVVFPDNGVVACTTPTLYVTLTNSVDVIDPMLDAWFDFDRNRSFGAGERIADTFRLQPGVNEVPISIPCDATVGGRSVARFRLSDGGVTSPGGSASSGEVEDYSVAVNAFGADAGPDQLVNSGSLVQLDASKSVGGQTPNYSWQQTAGTPVSLSDAGALQPTFTAPAGPATLTFQLTVDNGAGFSATDSVTITVNGVPTANAGPDQVVAASSTVTLDGSGSSDPEGDPLILVWQQTGGPTVSLSNVNAAKPTFTAPSSQATLTFELTANDGHAASLADSVTIRIGNPPVANAGPDQLVNAGNAVTLDSTGSSDPDNDPLTYAWTQTGGTAVSLTGATTTHPTFTAPAGPAALTFKVTVSDGHGGTSTDTVVITVNGAPVANAGPDQIVGSGATVTLDSTGSSDPDGNALTQAWTQLSGPTVTLTGASTTHPTFTAPTGPASIVLKVTVNDGKGASSTDTVIITVNGTPTASAGPDQLVNAGSMVTLDSTGSTDPDGDALAHAWTQTGGAAVSLTGASTTHPTFTAPTGPATLTFKVTVNDGKGGSANDSVTITVNGKPTASAGPDQAVLSGATVTLDATDSTDPDGDALTYAWSQLSGPTATLTGGTTTHPTFSAPTGPASLSFKVTVSDGKGGSANDSVTITVDGAPIASAGPDQLVNAGVTVTLDSTGSSDPDADPITHSWIQTAGPTVTLNGASTTHPTFTAPTGPATLTFRVTVADGKGASATDSVSIVVNGKPVANAGPDQSVTQALTVTLDGTGSSDPDGDAITYSWTQTSGPSVVLLGATTTHPTFVAPTGPATLVFKLTVSDGRGESANDSVTISVGGFPTANAGPDQLVNTGDTVTLDGTGSTDPDGDALTYAWTQLSGPTAALTGASTAHPTFTAPTGPTSLTYRLTVNDGHGGSSTDTVAITVNGAPTASAGPDQLVSAGATVTLDSTGSTDPDGNPLTHAWTQTGGTAVTLSGASTTHPTFTAPAGPATLTFKVTVSDGKGASGSDTVVVKVNGVPTAEAGPNQSAVQGATVTLDSTASTDPDGDSLTHAWTQTGGTAVTLSGASTTHPTFTAPAGPVVLTFKVTVNDGHGGTSSDTMTVSVGGFPVASAGPAQLVNAGNTVTLDSTGSTDPDGDPLTHAWTQTAGTPVTLAGATTTHPTFTAPAGPVVLTFKVTVNDGHSGTSSATVNITVNGVPTANAGPDQLVSAGSTVTLDSTGSTDPDGHALTHAWTQTAGSAVALAGASTTHPTFTAPTGPATLTFKVTVNDGHGATATDTVTIKVNGIPTAEAGPNQSVAQGATVTLDSTGSTDPDGDALTHAWTQTGGTTVALAGASTTHPTFTAPAGPVVLTFKVTVNDGHGGTSNDTVTVSIGGFPLADAGPAQLVNSGATVTLDGTGSTDPDNDPLTYAWTQTVGASVALAGASTAHPSFTAPTGPATLTFKLTVNDGHSGTSTDTVTITVNGAPVASAGPDQVVNPATTVTLDSTGSRDPDGNALTQAWTQLSGTAVTLTGASTAHPTFTAPAGPTTLTFKVTVNDGKGATASDTVAVKVNALPVANADSYGMVKNTTLAVTAPGVLGNDTDADGDALTAIAGTTAVAHGSLTLNANGSFSYTPTVGYTGPDSFTYRAKDATGQSAQATVSITVAASNASPVAVADSYQVAKGHTLTTAAPGVLANDTDAESNPLTAVIATAAQHGTVALQANGSFTYTPAAGYTGSDSFTYRASDGTTSSNTAQVSLLVLTPTEAFVRAVYGDFLTRAYDAAGGAFWVGRLDRGVETRTSFVLKMSRSHEYAVKIVSRAFVDVLGRTVDPSGREYWANKVQKGMPISTLTLQLIGSDEYLRHTGGTVAGFVNSTYQAILGRQPTASERTARVNEINAGKKRLAMATDLYKSVESRQRRVRVQYLDLLNRQPTTAELNSWVSQLATKADADLAVFLGASTEYYDNAQII